MAINKIRRLRVCFSISFRNGIHYFATENNFTSDNSVHSLAHFVRHKFMDLYTYPWNRVFVPEFDAQHKETPEETRTKVQSLAFFHSLTCIISLSTWKSHSSFEFGSGSVWWPYKFYAKHTKWSKVLTFKLWLDFYIALLFMNE